MDHEIDLTGDGGVMKKIITHAKDDAISPSKDLSRVGVHYRGILARNGRVFDSTREDNFIRYVELGKGIAMEAWEIALMTMKVGEVAKITCKPEYACGEEGNPPHVPPNATLIFEMELISCGPARGFNLERALKIKARENAKLEKLKKKREFAALMKEEERRKREAAKAAAAARVRAKLEAKKEGKGKGKGKAKKNIEGERICCSGEGRRAKEERSGECGCCHPCSSQAGGEERRSRQSQEKPRQREGKCQEKSKTTKGQSQIAC
ncbi:hypothetical protein DITRI_Ditri09bG0134100 [Diplodiscus trichospermus]